MMPSTATSLSFTPTSLNCFSELTAFIDQMRKNLKTKTKGMMFKWSDDEENLLAKCRKNIAGVIDNAKRLSLDTILSELSQTHSLNNADWLITLFELTLKQPMPVYKTGISDVLRVSAKDKLLPEPDKLTSVDTKLVKRLMNNVNTLANTEIASLKFVSLGKIDHDKYKKLLEKYNERTELLLVSKFHTKEVWDSYFGDLLKWGYTRVPSLLGIFVSILINTDPTKDPNEIGEKMYKVLLGLV